MFFPVIKQLVVANPYQRFGTNYGPIFNGCHETSVRNYHYQQRAFLIYFLLEAWNDESNFSSCSVSLPRFAFVTPGLPSGLPHTLWNTFCHKKLVFAYPSCLKNLLKLTFPLCFTLWWWVLFLCFSGFLYRIVSKADNNSSEERTSSVFRVADLQSCRRHFATKTNGWELACSKLEILFCVWELFQRAVTTITSHRTTQICYFIQNTSNYEAYKKELANMTKKTVALCDVHHYHKLRSSETCFNG